MKSVVDLEHNVLLAKTEAFCAAIDHVRNGRNNRLPVAEAFRESVGGFYPALERLVDDLKTAAKAGDVIAMLNARNTEFVLEPINNLDFEPDIDDAVNERYIDLATNRYGRRYTRQAPKIFLGKSDTGDRFKEHEMAVKALTDFIEVSALHHMARNNALGREHKELPRLTIQQTNAFVAKIREYIVGGEGNVVTLSFDRRPS